MTSSSSPDRRRPGARALFEDALHVLHECGVLTPGVWGGLAVYYALTPFNALLDGLSWLLLLRLFAAGEASTVGGPFVESVMARAGVPAGGTALLAWVAALFLAKAAAAVTLSLLDAAMLALARRRVQEALYLRLLRAPWTALRGDNVGRWMGSLTEETPHFVKLFLAALQALYSLLQCAVLLALAFMVEKRLSLFLGAVAIPVWVVLRLLYRWQGRISARQARARQDFVADVNERLTGIYQVKASGETPIQERLGLRHQPEMFGQELRAGWTVALLTAFNPLLFCVMLTAYLALATWRGSGSVGDLLALGSVSILAFRAASQLNLVVGALGNVSRLSGSIEPLKRIVAYPREAERAPLPEPLASIRLEDVSYSVGRRAVLRGLAFVVERGRVLLVTGPSGAGKTTLANLIAGLDQPSSGRVLYRGVSGADRSAAEFRARIAYVPQDIHLFSGTVRENLDPEGARSDAELLEALDATGARAFADRLGGLDGRIAEAGRSLSGGEKRRLGIAKALAQHAECLILDEITNGLDEASKTGLLKTVETLSKRLIIIAVSHDLAAFASADTTRFELAPS